MIRKSAVLTLVGLTLTFGAANAASAADALFMAPAKAAQLMLQAAPASDLRSGPAAPAVIGLGQPELGVRPEVLAYTGASTGDEIRLRLSDAFYRQGLVIAPGPAGAAQAEGAPDLIALRLLTGVAHRTCVFACIGATGLGDWLEAAPKPLL